MQFRRKLITGTKEKIMKTVKDSIIGLALLLMLIAVGVTLMPLVGRGQGDSQNAPPHRAGRKFYLTQTVHDGSQALTACADGYHMASFWEISDPSNLRYNINLGATLPDSGLGPPNQPGWIRTGGSADIDDVPGQGNCLSWTSTAGGHAGTSVQFSLSWADPAQQASPWRSQAPFCDVPQRVWCVEN
jgi:hypothetical protein